MKDLAIFAGAILTLIVDKYLETNGLIVSGLCLLYVMEMRFK